MLGLRLGSERWSQDPERQALMQIGVTQRAREPGTADFQDHGGSPHRSPHGLYRALILAHGRRVNGGRNGLSLGNMVTRSHC
jgi:hypothetical protein